MTTEDSQSKTLSQAAGKPPAQQPPQKPAQKPAKKPSWIRLWGLGVFVAIILFWTLCIDWIIEASFESIATEINGAKVELDSAQLTLWPTSLALNGLQVTNPSAPMSNTVSASTISTNLDGLKLLRRQVIIDQATISGLGFNTPRQYSGETETISRKISSGNFNFDIGGAIPGVSLPDTDQLLEEEEAHLKQEVKQIEERIEAIKERWDENIKQLPDDDKVDEYKARWKKAKKGNVLEKISALNEIKDDVDEDLKQIKSLDDQLDADKKQLQQEITNAKTLPQREAQRLMAKAGLGTGDGSFMGSLTGDMIKQYLQQGLALFNQVSNKLGDAKEEETKPRRGEGQWIQFTEHNPLPGFLLRRLDINGNLSIAQSSITFDGRGSDFAYPPQDWTKPATLQLQGTDTSKASFNLQANFDHRSDKADDQMNFTIQQLPLVNLALTDKPELKIALQQAVSNIDGFIRIQQKQLDLKLDTDFNQVQMAVNSNKDNTTQRVITDTLKAVEQFDLSLSANGNISKPNVKLRSNLDSILGKQLKQQVTAQTDKLQEKLQAKIQQKLGPELSGVTSDADYFKQLEDLIAKRKNDISEVGKL